MSFKCPDCDRVSHNPNDETQQYCGACHKFFEDNFSFEKIDTGHNATFGDPEMTRVVRNTIAEYELEDGEIFALVFLANGRGHFMTVEAPADRVKFIDGKQILLENTHQLLVMKKSQSNQMGVHSRQVALHVYREVDLTKGLKIETEI